MNNAPLAFFCSVHFSSKTRMFNERPASTFNMASGFDFRLCCIRFSVFLTLTSDPKYK